MARKEITTTVNELVSQIHDLPIRRRAFALMLCATRTKLWTYLGATNCEGGTDVRLGSSELLHTYMARVKEWANLISRTRHRPSLLHRCSGRGRSSKPHQRSRCISHASGRYNCSCKRMPTLRKPFTAKRFLRWLVCHADKVGYFQPT